MEEGWLGKGLRQCRLQIIRVKDGNTTAPLPANLLPICQTILSIALYPHSVLLKELP